MRKHYLSKLPFWSIPMVYAGVAIVVGLIFPRLEFRYLAGYRHGMTVSVATSGFFFHRFRHAGAHGYRFFSGLCDGSVQQHRLFAAFGFVVQP